LNILIVTPAAAGSRKGNRVTALRWAGHLRALGHHLVLRHEWTGEPCDVLVALHAVRSAEVVRRSREEARARPIIVCMTGTDLYGDLEHDAVAMETIERADRLVVLQSEGVTALPPRLRAKARVIHQSVPPFRAPGERPPPPDPGFPVAVLAHLRTVKDPLRMAAAARLLPASSALRVIHLGAALDAELAATARAEMAANPRYEWRGDVPRREALAILERCRLLALTSVLEGGANCVSEALALGVPVVSTRIAGSIGLLGADYPGYFEVGDTAALASLLLRAESDAEFYAALTAACVARRALVDPARERQAWAELLAELPLDAVPPAAPAPSA
jgi:putative glycosyltransferase (TIGR04348 family)